MPKEDTDTRREAQPDPSMAIIAVVHGKPISLHVWANQSVADHVEAIGEDAAWSEAYSYPIDGVWVCELRLVPSDLPPECRLEASGFRQPTTEEWARHISDEWDGEIPVPRPASVQSISPFDGINKACIDHASKLINEKIRTYQGAGFNHAQGVFLAAVACLAAEFDAVPS